MQLVPYKSKVISVSRGFTLEFSELMGYLERDQEIGVVVFVGTGSQFLLGADLTMFKDLGMKDQIFQDFTFRHFSSVLKDFRKPTIAAVNGLAFGGGVELAIHCDIILASDKAKLALSETTLGLIPGAGGTQNLRDFMSKSNMMKMVLTGDPISAKEAKRIGLVLEVYKSEELIQKTLQLAQKIAQNDQIVLSFAKRLQKRQPLQVGLFAERETSKTLAKVRKEELNQ